MDSFSVTILTGPLIKARRRALDINQTDMGKLIGCSRHAVSYWETQRAEIDCRRLKWGVPARMLSLLGITVLPINPQSYARTRDGVLQQSRTRTHAQGDGVLSDSQQEWVDRECARLNAREIERAAKYCQPCDAKTRKGHPCKNKSEPGRRRCKFHGGMSTGPKTAAGRKRIAEAQRARWAAYRMNVNQSTSSDAV